MHKSIRQRSATPAKATLAMVAERAGVSPSTVSRILNGTAVVSDEKRAAVDQAIAKQPLAGAVWIGDVALGG